MDFNLTDDQQAIVSMAKDVVNAEMIPLAREFDEREAFPVEIMDKLRECRTVQSGYTRRIWRARN